MTRHGQLLVRAAVAETRGVELLVERRAQGPQLLDIGREAWRVLRAQRRDRVARESDRPRKERLRPGHPWPQGARDRLLLNHDGFAKSELEIRDERGPERRRIVRLLGARDRRVEL